MIGILEKDLLKLNSENIDEVDQGLSSIVDRQDRLAVPHMIKRLKNTPDANIRNAVAIALSDLHANEAVPVLFELIEDPKNEGYTGSLLYALQNLDCRNYFLDFVEILSQGNFESSEMALELIEKYEGDLDYATKLRAINSLEEHEKRIRSTELKEPDKFDRIHYIEHALKLLRD